jgi:hypothetical protein
MLRAIALERQLAPIIVSLRRGLIAAFAAPPPFGVMPPAPCALSLRETRAGETQLKVQ